MVCGGSRSSEAEQVGEFAAWPVSGERAGKSWRMVMGVSMRPPVKGNDPSGCLPDGSRVTVVSGARGETEDGELVDLLLRLHLVRTALRFLFRGFPRGALVLAQDSVEPLPNAATTAFAALLQGGDVIGIPFAASIFG